MQVVIAPSAELDRIGAAEIAALLRRKPHAVIGLATGSSPLGIYRELARRHREEGLSFQDATGFMLDEYVGIALDHPERYRNFIQTNIADPVAWPASQVHGPDGAAADLVAACAAYENAIQAAGGVDLQILGIGSDGHIAFNEPGSSLVSRTRPITLTAQTIADNARFFDGDVSQVPTMAVTQGIGTIMEARELLLIATGDAKATAVAHLVEGAISARWPATILQMHPQALVLIDDDAAAQLELADFYRESSRHLLAV